MWPNSSAIARALARYVFLTIVVKIKHVTRDLRARKVRPCCASGIIIVSAAKMGGTSPIKNRKAPSANDTQAPKAVRMRVSDLLADTREAILEHNGQEYRLRITANGKLILTK